MKVYYLIFIGLILGMGTANAGVIQSTETSTVGNNALSAMTSITNANDTNWATAANFTCGGSPCTPPSMDENYTYNSIWNESYTTSLTLEVLIEKTDDSAASISYYNYSSSTYNTTYALTNANSGKKINITLPKEQVFSDGSPIRLRYTGDSIPSATFKVNETKLYWLYNSSIINITFDKGTNVTVMWAGDTEYYDTITNIYNFTKYYPVGEISMQFGNNQIIQFWNSNTTDIVENVTVSAAADIQQMGYLWSQDKQIADERIRIYLASNGSYKLYQSVLSGRDGYFTINVVNGIYLFVVNRTGYDYYSQLKPTSGTNTLYLYLSNGTSDTNKITVYTNCPLKTPTNMVCYLNTAATRAGTFVKYIYHINDTAQSSTNGTTATPNGVVQITVTLNPTQYRWNITTEVDGTNITSMTTEWENLTNRTVQINIPSTPVSREDLPLVALIIMVTAATIAAIINQYAPGTGIYTYGVILAGWTTFSGIFWVPATIAGFFLAINIAKKIVG